MTDASRRELKSQGVSVSLVEPAYVATPIFENRQSHLKMFPKKQKKDTKLKHMLTPEKELFRQGFTNNSYLKCGS